jgi:hypothetical protein
MGYFHYDTLQFRYEPYPIGYAKPILAEDAYRALADAYPAQEMFAYLEKVGHKFTLSERFNPKAYQQFVRGSAVWRDFHRWVKSDAFIAEVMDVLRRHHIDLGHGRPLPVRKRLVKMVKDFASSRARPRAARLSTRFEFSMLPADGGSVMPHSDSPNKIVTLIISMIRDGEWEPAFGGGTDVNRPLSPALSFNELNRQARFEDMEVIDTFAFTPNQAVIFVKTFNSWHSVRPMTGGDAEAMRKTLTINIESR